MMPDGIDRNNQICEKKCIHYIGVTIHHELKGLIRLPENLNEYLCLNIESEMYI